MPLLKVHNDLVCDVDDCCVSQLVLLDLSAAFDMMDHQILLCVLSEHLVSAALHVTGSSPISVNEPSHSSMSVSPPTVVLLHAVYHRGPF